MFIEEQFNMNCRIWGCIAERKKRAPRYTEKQIEEVPKCYIVHYWKRIMDDEKYLTLTNESTSTNRRFYTSDSSVTSSEVKFKRTEQKFWCG